MINLKSKIKLLFLIILIILANYSSLLYASNQTYTGFVNTSYSYNNIILLNNNLYLNMKNITYKVYSNMKNIKIDMRLNINPMKTVKIGPYNVSYVELNITLNTSITKPKLEGIIYDNTSAFPTLIINMMVNPEDLGLSSSVTVPTVPEIKFNRLYLIFNDIKINNNLFIKFTIKGESPIYMLYYLPSIQYELRLINKTILNKQENYTIYTIYINPITGYAYKLKNGTLYQIGYLPLYTIWGAYPKLRTAYVEAAIYSGIYEYLESNPEQLNQIILYLKHVLATQGPEKAATEINNVKYKLFQNNVLNRYFNNKTLIINNYNTTIISDPRIELGECTDCIAIDALLNTTIINKLNKYFNIINKNITVLTISYNGYTDALAKILNNYYKGNINNLELIKIINNNITINKKEISLRDYTQSELFNIYPILYSYGRLIVAYTPFMNVPYTQFFLTVPIENESLKELFASYSLPSSYMRISSIPNMSGRVHSPDNENITFVYNLSTLPLPIFNYNNSDGVRCRVSLILYSSNLLYYLLINATYDLIDYHKIPEYFKDNLTSYALHKCNITSRDLNIALELLNGKMVNLTLLKSLYAPPVKNNATNSSNGSGSSPSGNGTGMGGSSGSGVSSGSRTSSSREYGNVNGNVGGSGSLFYVVPVLVAVVGVVLLVYVVRGSVSRESA